MLCLLSRGAWSYALIDWQIRHLGWYFVTATEIVPVLVTLVPLALVMAGWTPGGRASRMHLARLLGVLALAVALVTGVLAWPSGDSRAGAAPRRLHVADWGMMSGGGPVELIDGTPDRRIIVLDQSVPGFAARSAFVMMRDDTGRASPVFVELAPRRPGAIIGGDAAHGPQPGDWAPPGRGGYRIDDDLQGMALALLAHEDADNAPPHPVVLMRDRAAARRTGLVAALQAMLLALVLGLAACLAAWQARRTARG